MPRTPRPRRPLSSQRSNDHTRDGAENQRRAGHPPTASGLGQLRRPLSGFVWRRQ
jgi:hypothetical protein